MGVIKRNWRSRGYAGSLLPPKEGQATRAGATSWLVVPVEKRFPYIRIQTRQVWVFSSHSAIHEHGFVSSDKGCRHHFDIIPHQSSHGMLLFCSQCYWLKCQV